MNIPFINLKAQYDTIRAGIDEAMSSAVSEFRFIKGAPVEEFEKKISALVGTSHGVAVGNGTDALFLSLKALGISEGDEVITPAWSWISSAETISMCGAKPVFADVDENHYTLNPELIFNKVTSRTKAIIVVHLYGQAAPVDSLAQFCKTNNLKLVEDCAQAHLTQLNGRVVGSFSDAAAFSFYPTKNLGAYGDAGCVLTSSSELASKIRRLANHGALRKDDHQTEGFNSRMDTLQAAVLLAKLPHLEKWNLGRRTNAMLYRSELENIKGIKIPIESANTVHTYHIYAIQAQQRDRLKEFLATKGIETMIHYPKALTNLPFYKNKIGSAAFPVSDRLEKTMLSLPIYPELTEAEILYICNSISEFYA
jgi:dTDP-4-amino-4,6-dideoxygalactose transaminase